jgi:hypothetical protein
VSLVAPEHKDPILARWQYGLGKSAAFTSDCKNRWSPYWIEDPSGVYHKFWGQLARSIMRSPFQSLYSSRMTFDKQAGAIEVEALEDGQPVNYLGLKAQVVLPDGKDLEIPLRQQGPGIYRGEFDGKQVGPYFAVIVNEKTGQPIGKMQHSIPYSPEYMTTQDDPYLLKSLASAAGGTCYDSLDEAAQAKAFAHDDLERKTYREMWKQMLLAAIALLLVEVAIRRLVLPELRGGTRTRVKAAEKPAFKNLLQRKQERIKGEREETERLDFLRVRKDAQQPAWSAPRSSKPRITPAPPAEPKKETPAQPAGEDTFDRLLRAKKKHQQ